MCSLRNSPPLPEKKKIAQIIPKIVTGEEIDGEVVIDGPGWA